MINELFKALSHPIRRDIVNRLKNGPMTAGDLAACYDVSKPTMSTHFTALKSADLIRSERDGVTINYHLNVTIAEEALTIMLDLLGTGERSGEGVSQLQTEIDQTRKTQSGKA